MKLKGWPKITKGLLRLWMMLTGFVLARALAMTLIVLALAGCAPRVQYIETPCPVLPSPSALMMKELPSTGHFSTEFGNLLKGQMESLNKPAPANPTQMH